MNNDNPEPTDNGGAYSPMIEIPPTTSGPIGRHSCDLPQEPGDWNHPHLEPAPFGPFKEAIDAVTAVVAEINKACMENNKIRYGRLRDSYKNVIGSINKRYMDAGGNTLEFPTLLWNGKCIYAFILQEHEARLGPLVKHSSSSKGMT